MNSLCRAVHQFASEQPDTIALESHDQRFDYHALNKQIEQLSLVLHARGVKVLALYADNSPQWVIADLASQRAGICLLPLPTFFSDAQLHHAVTTSGADALLTDSPGRLPARSGSARGEDVGLAGMKLHVLESWPHAERQ